MIESRDLCDTTGCDANKLRRYLDPTLANRTISSWVRVYHDIGGPVYLAEGTVHNTITKSLMKYTRIIRCKSTVHIVILQTLLFIGKIESKRPFTLIIELHCST